jgi:predicted ATPase
MPGFFGLAAHGKAMLGRLDEALATVEEGIAEAERTRQRLHVGPLHRVRGALLLGGGDVTRAAEAERCFRHALDAAQAIGAHLPALQAATSLAGLWVRQGRAPEARALLAPLHAAFREGLDLPDLRAAAAVLGRC